MLALALLADLAFIQFDRMYLQGRLDERFSLDNESGYAELYQNAKELVAALLAGAYLLRKREPLYLCWSGIFTYIFLDDTFQLHETVGAWISARERISGAFGLRPVDFGELIVSGAAGLGVCVSLVVAWRRSGATARRVTRTLIGLLLSLAFFGVLMDMLHVLATGPWEYRLGIIEDGGEMIVVTALLWALAVHFPAGARES
jgi:hypothetical protein